MASKKMPNDLHSTLNTFCEHKKKERNLEEKREKQKMNLKIKTNTTNKRENIERKKKSYTYRELTPTIKINP